MHARSITSIGILSALSFVASFAYSAPNRLPTTESNGDTDPNKERRDWMNRGNAEYVQKRWETARDYYRNSWDIKHHTQSDSNARFTSCMPHCSAPEQASIANLDQSARSQRTAGIIGFVVGGVGIATGATLLALEPKKSRPNAAFVRPWFGAGQAGLYGAF